MDRKKINELVETFFVCDKKQLSEIFNELLSVVEVEQASGPGGLMSRNYETAQANPEINTIAEI